MYAEIKGCPGFIITRNGVVFNTVKGQIVAPFIRNGYKCVRMHDKNFYIHRLLAEAFIPNPENEPEINHKDGKKLNNDLSNLEWSTYSKNISHAYRTGLRATTQVRCIEENQLFDSIKEAESFYGMANKTLYRHLSGKSKTCRGLHWEKTGEKIYK